MLLSTFVLNLPDAQDIPLGDLPIQQPPFTVHIECLHHDDLVHEFHGVIGKDGDLVQSGNYVKLSSSHFQVCGLALYTYIT